MKREDGKNFMTTKASENKNRENEKVGIMLLVMSH